MKPKKLAALVSFFAVTRLAEPFAAAAERPQAPAVSTQASSPVPLHRVNWFDEKGQPGENAQTLLRFLQDAPSHGMSPDVYNTQNIAKIMAAPLHPVDRAPL